MDKEAFKKEIVPLQPLMSRIAHRYFKEEQEIEDVVQETFIRLWKIRFKLGQYRSKEALVTTIVKNLCLDNIKKRKRFQSDIDPIIKKKATTGSTPYIYSKEKENIELIKKIIESLPNLQQAVIQMKDIEGYEITEIAEITNTNVESVRNNLSRARKKVRQLFLKIHNYYNQ